MNLPMAVKKELEAGRRTRRASTTTRFRGWSDFIDSQCCQINNIIVSKSQNISSTPSGPKSRSVYITVERILKFKETPGCKGCFGTSRLHTDECRRRFASLVEAERKEALDRREEPAVPEGAAPSAPGASPEVPASVVELTVQKATTYDNHMLECSSRKLPRFGRPKLFVPACMASNNPFNDVSQSGSQPSSSSSSQFRVPNKRNRKKNERLKGVGPDSPLFEFACDPESQMGITSEMYGVPHVRLSREFGDLTDPEVIAQLDYQIWESRMAPNLWGAIPCTSGSPWQLKRRCLVAQTNNKVKTDVCQLQRKG